MIPRSLLRWWTIVAIGWLGGGGVAPAKGAEVSAATAVAPAELARQAAAPAWQDAEQSLRAMRLPPGWNAAVFAADPLVANIVAFDIDPQGRVFVCESFRQNRGVTDNREHDEAWLLADLAAQTVQDRIDYHRRLLGPAAGAYTEHDDRIRRLRDSDGDGRADESLVFAEGFNRLEEGTGAGILVRGPHVYYTCIPKLWRLVDQDDDGRAEQRTALSDGYGVRVAFRGHDLHGPIFGPDGRLYFSIGDRGHNVTTAEGRVLANAASGSIFRCEPDGSELEVIATGLRNPQELAFNDYGDLFTGDNNSDSGDPARIVHVVQGGDSGWRMHYQYLPDRGPFNREKIWQRYDPSAHPEQPAYIVPPIGHLSDGPAGFAFDPGTGVDPSLRGRFLLCDFRGGASNSGIRSFQLEPAGASYTLSAEDAPIWNVLATDVAFGPDGALWVSDWVHGWDGVDKGRLYRLTGPGFDAGQAAEVAEILAGDWRQVAPERLAQWLGHADRRIRNESQWELVRRGETPRLVQVLADPAAAQLARLHALWGIEQRIRYGQRAGEPLDAALTDTLLASLRDADAVLRAAAAGAVGQRKLPAGREPLVMLLRDPSPRVRFHAALGLAALGLGEDPATFAAVVAMLADNDDQDPMLRHAGVMALAASESPARLVRLKQNPTPSVRRAVVVALRRLRAAEVADFLSDPDPLVVLEAARAIHDVPLAVGLEPLAKLVETPRPDDALMRRVLNANYRLGTPEAAVALAQYAAKPIAPQALRVEALTMLRRWPQPDPRDRVLSDLRPLPMRPAAVAKAALAKALPLILKNGDGQNGDEVCQLAITIAAEYGVLEVMPVLRQQVDNPRLRPEARGQALRSLASLAPAQAAQAALPLLHSGQGRLQIAAMETIAAADPEGSIEILRQGTRSETFAQRQAAWDLLAKLDSPPARELITAGVRDYLSGQLPADTALNVVEAAGEWLDPELAAALDEHQQQLEQHNPLGRWWLSLEGGNSSLGAEIFRRTQLSCVRCHRTNGSGGEVGPDLSAIAAQRDRRYLLESLCLPDAAIAPGFETVVIADDLGQVFSGIVRHEDEHRVELIQADGRVVQLDQAAITRRKRGPSAMPGDLVKQLSPRELRDLVAYLASLKADSGKPTPP